MKKRTLLASGGMALAIILSGCSPAADNIPADDPAPTRTAPARAASHLVVDVSGADVPTRERIPTDGDSILVGPFGTVIVESIESTPSVPGSLVGTGAGSREMAVPAEGEAFLVVTVTATGTDDGDGLVVAFEMDAQSVPAPALRGGGPTTLLVSVPAYGEAFLTVEDDGRVQRVNLADGKRDEKTRDEGRRDGTPGVLTPR